METCPEDVALASGISAGGALAACFGAACFACLWNPLSTFAHTHRKPEPCEMMFLFGLGALLAIPAIVVAAARLESITARVWLDTWRGLTSRQALFGLLCGLMVNTGFTAFFASQDQVQETVAFAITSCSGLVAILADAITGAFRSIPRKAQGLFFSAAMCYTAAIAVLAAET